MVPSVREQMMIAMKYATNMCVYALCSLAGMDPDFYWLGNVPCRAVQFYGVIAGVQVYEQRVVYTG